MKIIEQTYQKIEEKFGEEFLGIKERFRDIKFSRLREEVEEIHRKYLEKSDEG